MRYAQSNYGFPRRGLPSCEPPVVGMLRFTVGDHQQNNGLIEFGKGLEHSGHYHTNKTATNDSNMPLFLFLKKMYNSNSRSQKKGICSLYNAHKVTTDIILRSETFGSELAPLANRRSYWQKIRHVLCSAGFLSKLIFGWL